MLRMRHTLFASLLMIIATFAMTTTGFSHRFTEDRLTPELLTYLSMGGTFEDICGDSRPAHHLRAGCDACLINSTVFLANADNSVPLPISVDSLAQFSLSQHLWRACATGINHPARAPPALVIS